MAGMSSLGGGGDYVPICHVYTIAHTVSQYYAGKGGPENESISSIAGSQIQGE